MRFGTAISRCIHRWRANCKPLLWSAYALAMAALLIGYPRSARTDPLPTFTDAERRSILTHGPWPMPWKPDPTNRVSGNPRAAALGRKLFFDDKLSRFGALSCATCHKPEIAWGDGRAQASSAARLERNTLPLYNLRHAKWFGWDGASDSLWLHSLRPLLDPREMAASPEHVAAQISNDPGYSIDYIRIFGTPPTRQQPEAVLINVAKSLAAFQETITTASTPFDDFRHALARRDQAAQHRYPVSAARGLKLFVGKAGCNACHSGPLFSDGTFRNTAVPSLPNQKAADAGRSGGLQRLMESPFDRFRKQYNDQLRQPLKRLDVAPPTENTMAAFKVPSLRNVALSGPYMHNGSKTTLLDAISQYAIGNDAISTPIGSASRDPHRRSLSAGEIADLHAFLQTLTEPRAPSSPDPKNPNQPKAPH